MNLAPIYELRSRLRTAMIAGTNRISEDFRLKRAVEDIKPLEALSPVFAKIGQLAASLLEENGEDREGVLIDTIMLVDALLCTQGQVAVTGEIAPLTVNNWGSVITNAPYSAVKTLVEALTTSGNGHFQFVVDTHKEKPELFKDYRVKSAMVAALGAAYAELAEQVAVWLKEEGEEIVPLLQRDFDPKGKKEMLRRVQVMESVAGGKCNDFYVRMLPEAERDVKNELIYALRYDVDNLELLLELAKKEKGNAKKMAYYALAAIEDERAEKLFGELYERKPMDALIYLRMTSTEWASKMVGESLISQLAVCKEPGYGKGDKVFTVNDTEVLRMAIEALPGKSGAEICEAFRTAYEVEDIYCKGPQDEKGHPWEMHVPVRRWGIKIERKRLAGAMAYFLESAIRINPDADLCALAQELYEKKSAKNNNKFYFSAVLAAKLLDSADCTEWLRNQIFEKGLLGIKKDTSFSAPLETVLEGLYFDESKGSYVLQTRMRDEANEVVTVYEQMVTQDIGGAFSDLLMKYAMLATDRQLVHFVNPKDKESCKKFEEYFYQRALTGPTDGLRNYWAGLRKCGCARCEGLLAEYVKRNSGKRDLPGWDVYSRLWELPGTAEAFEKEAEAVRKMICDGKVKVRNWNDKHFDEYMENVKEKKRSIFKEREF